MSMIPRLEQLLAAGQESPMLRLGLGNAYLQAGEAVRALEHLEAALRLQADYSAAWKSYGRALADAGRPEEAKRAYLEGIAAAGRRGDIQAAREMKVFLKRLEKGGGS